MLKRILNLLSGFFGRSISQVEHANPELILTREQENLRKQIGQYNSGLATHAGLCERLIAQVKLGDQEQRDLRAKTAANLRVGNSELASQYALRLQTVERDLDENRTQLSQAEHTYKNLLSARDVSIEAARSKIAALQYGLNDLKMKRALAELTEMASGMITSIGGSGDTLDRLQGMIENQRQLAAGRARVASDTLDMSSIQIKESEHQALAHQALAEFALKEGIAVPSRMLLPEKLTN